MLMTNAPRRFSPHYLPNVFQAFSSRDPGMGLRSAFLHLSSGDLGMRDHVRLDQPIGLVQANGLHRHSSPRWRDAKPHPLPVAGPMLAAEVAH